MTPVLPDSKDEVSFRTAGELNLKILPVAGTAAHPAI